MVEEDKVAFKPIKIGLLGELSLEVLEGLDGGEKIVNGSVPRPAQPQGRRHRARARRPPRARPPRRRRGTEMAPAELAARRARLAPDAHAAQLPDAARHHHRRDHHRRGRRRSSPGSRPTCRDRVIQLAPDVFVIDQVRHHPRARGVPRGAEASRLRLPRLRGDARPPHPGRDGGAPTSQTGAAVRHAGKRLADMRVHGSTPNLGALLNLDIEAGRFFTEADERSGAAVAVIGWDIQRRALPGRRPDRARAAHRQRGLPHRRRGGAAGTDARPEPGRPGLGADERLPQELGAAATR